MPEQMESIELRAFIADCARYEAVDVIADRRVFQLDQQQMTKFENILNRPVRENAKLQRLLTEKNILLARLAVDSLYTC